MELIMYLCFLLPFFLLLFFALKNSGRSHAELPPGPWELPIIGSIHHLVGKLPHNSFRDLSKKYGPLMFLNLGDVPTLVVSSPEAAREIMKTCDITFASRPMIAAVQIMSYGSKSVAFAPYGDYWRELRKISVLELLSSKRVQSFRPIREEELHNLVRSIPDASVVNLSRRLFVAMNDITIRSIVGDKSANQDALLDVLSEAVQVSGGFNLVDLFPSSTLVRLFGGVAAKMEKCQQKVDSILDGIIRERTDQQRSGEYAGEKNLLDVLLRIQEAEGNLQFPLPVESIKTLVNELFSAGSETAATTIDWAMSELMRNPRVMKKAQSEAREVFVEKGKVITEAELSKLNYLKLIIKETLRLHPPLPLLLPRECREACRVLGYKIPERTRVVVNVWAIGRDPHIWDNAEDFVPERFDGSVVDYKGMDFEYIPFGAGRRMCPGISSGLANVELTLAALLFHFDWKLPPGVKQSELDMTEAFGLTARRKEELQLLAVSCFP